MGKINSNVTSLFLGEKAAARYRLIIAQAGRKGSITIQTHRIKTEGPAPASDTRAKINRAQFHQRHRQPDEQQRRGGAPRAGAILFPRGDWSPAAS